MGTTSRATLVQHPALHSILVCSARYGLLRKTQCTRLQNSSVGGRRVLHLHSMEALETAINYWDDALAAYTSLSAGGAPLAVTSSEEAEFSKDLQGLLDAAYRLQDQCELLFLDQRSVLFRTDSSTRLHGDTSTAITSSPESFVSAQDEVADLREFEEFADIFPDSENLPLYQSALKKLEEGGIPYRCLRTQMVHCSSDIEFLGKLHCIRLSFQYLFKDSGTWLWFADTGRQMLADLIIFAEKDPKDFLIAYEDMLDFLQEQSNWISMEQELSLKGVKSMTFYDVVLDYILMDAFEDLESPPSSVTAVVQNRWLSNGFKETALTTAVWSVLKAKRRMLKFPYGFMSHFYAISEQMSPLMAWGFLGPDENLKDICQFFKDQVMGFLLDIFSFQKCRYTTVEELAQDLLSHLRSRAEAVNQKVSIPTSASGAM
ncbi:mitoguardin isoform X2 [Periplaneta americana]|uniref:mitoguardin isoform X2 n=1 Tax=Periplaneta americana TaxID=6978 RepID=UPI0037E91A5D